MLTSSPKISHVIKRDVSQLNLLGIDQWIWQSCCDADSNSAPARLPCCLPKGSLNQGFLDIYLTKFSESVISNSMRESFLSKCSKFHLEFGIAARNREKVFCFWDNCIWIGTVKLSLLRRWYFSSAANVLKSSTNIWYANSRDFFQLNLLGSDQRTW